MKLSSVSLEEGSRGYPKNKRKDLEKMKNLLGQAVKHKRFGKGVITALSENKMCIRDRDGGCTLQSGCSGKIPQ